MELRREYQAILQSIVETCTPHSYAAVRYAVERCQALASKPPKELTDAELCKIADNMPNGFAGFFKEWGWRQYWRAVIAAHERKRREPETFKYRVAWNKNTKSVEMFEVDTDGSAKNRYFVSAGWKWLDIDGKPQEFVVRVP